jgi:hypothetical protein
MLKRHWVIGSLGVVLVVFGLVVRFVGGPVLLRFPLNTDQKLHYRGTVSVGINPTTMVPLSSPLRLPLTVTRTVRVKSGSFSEAVIDEVIATTFAGSTRTETYQYVMDRRTMELRNSRLSYAFGNRLDVMTSIGGSYRINLPMGTTSAGRYTVWAPEIDATVAAIPTGAAHHSAIANTQVITFKVDFEHHVASYYLAYLKRNGFPSALSSESLATELRAHGASTTQVLQAATPYLTSSQLASLRTTIARLRVPLEYFYFEKGQISIQPSTGALVDAKSTREGVAVAPDLSALHSLAASLSHLPRLTAVQHLNSALAAMAAPRDVLDLSYAQTQSSVRAVTATADSQAAMIALITWQLPIALVALGVVAVLVALLWRPRRRAKITVLPLARHGEQPPIKRADKPA